MDELAVFEVTPPELAAIEEHKYYMSERRGREVAIVEAIVDFRCTHRDGWLRVRFCDDLGIQRSKILEHKYFRSAEVGHDIGPEVAAMEWIPRYGPLWRVHRESLDGNGFSCLDIPVGQYVQPALSPIERLREIARGYSVDLFLHKEGIAPVHFTMNGRAYWHVRQMPESDPEPRVLAGDKLQVVAFGKNAAQAIEDIVLLLAAHPVG